MASGAREAVIGLDLGTTDIKAIAFDANGQPLARAQRSSGLMRGADGAAELDPSAVVAAAEGALAEAAATASGQGYDVARVGISAAMHSLIPIGPDGAALAPAMTWADLRPQAEADALWRSPIGPDVYTRTGTPVHAMSPLAKLLWLKRARPDKFDRATMFAGLKEWLWNRWFGEWAVDVSLAGAMGLYALGGDTWDTGALALAGVSPERLPRVVPTTYARDDLAPHVASRLGLPAGAVIVTGGSDGTLANLGVGALDGRYLVMTIGTSLAVRRGVSSPATNPATRVFCYPLAPGRLISGTASNSGGAALEWLYQRLLSGFGGGVIADGLPQALAQAESASANGMLFLPYLAGERAPLWSAQTRGALLGLAIEHRAADVLRAAVEGILLNAAWLVEQVVDHGEPPAAIIATGGVFKSDWIAQVAADICGLPLIVAASVDASSCGAALLADIAAGVRTWEQAESAASAALGSATHVASRPAEAFRNRERLREFRRQAEALATSAGM
jgi:gluconokinase